MVYDDLSIKKRFILLAVGVISGVLQNCLIIKLGLADLFQGVQKQGCKGAN